MSVSRVLAVAKVAFREFWRTPEAVFWTYGFPLLMTIVLGFAFKPSTPQPLPVAVVAGADAEAMAAALRGNPRLQVEVLDEIEADVALARGRVGALVRGTVADPRLRADPARPDAELARLQVERALRDAQGHAWVEPVFTAEDRPGSRYIDFLIPGLIGLNLLGAGMWGIGFNLVQYRTQNLLRRLLVTPLGRGEFLAGFLCSRLLLVLPESAVIAAFGVLFWGVPFRGSVLAGCLLVLAGSLAFSGLGVLVASRAKTIEGVAGLMNLFMLPMWLLGGAFFSNERMEGVLRWAAEALPLSWFNAAMRDVMLAPGGLVEAGWAIGLLTAFAAVCFGLALKIFRWT